MLGYRGYRARKSLARQHPPGRAQIAHAVPPGSRRLRGRSIEKQYLAALTADPRVRAMRADGRESLLLIARYLARCADYAAATTRPTRLATHSYARRSQSTWKAARRRLEAWGYLGTVTPGRCYWLGDQSRHDAAVYVITVPRYPPAPLSARSRPPTGSAKRTRAHPRARGAAEPRSGAAAGRGRARFRRRRRDAHAAAATGAGAAHARALRTGPGKTITDGWAGWLLAPFVRSGWTPADVAWAVDHLPDGSQHHAPVRDVLYPERWLRWRLSHWLDPEPGDRWKHAGVVASRSQAAAADHAAQLERQAAERAAWQQRELARAKDPGARADAIREANKWPQPRRDTP